MILLSKALLGLRFVAALDAETSVGQTPKLGLPTTSVVETETTTTAVLAPSVGWQSRPGASPVFTSAYSPRALWRMSDSAPTGAEPLLLHQVTLSYGPTASERTNLRFDAAGSIGDVDRGAQAQVFANNQNAPLTADLRAYTASFTASLSHLLTHLWTFQMTVPVVFQGPFGEQPDDEFFVLEDSRSIGLSLDFSRALTPRHAISISSSSQLAEFQTNTAFSTAAYVGWNAQLSRLSQFGLRAGAGTIVELEREENAPPGAVSQSGDVFVAGDATLAQTRRHGSDNLAFSLSTVVDPFTQRLRPTASLTATTTEALSERLSFGASLGASTVTTMRALPEDPNETAINASVGLGWRHNQLGLRSGLQGSVRGPNLDPDREQEFLFRERLIVLFLGLHWDITRTP